MCGHGSTKTLSLSLYSYINICMYIYLKGTTPSRDFLCSHSVVLGMGTVESVKYFLYWPLLRIGPGWSELSQSMLLMRTYPLVKTFRREYVRACLNTELRVTWLLMSPHTRALVRSSPREECISTVLSSLGLCIRCVSGEERHDGVPVIVRVVSDLVPNSYSGSKITSF